MRVLFATLGVTLLFAEAGRAHDFYPPQCRSGRDCCPIQPDEVRRAAMAGGKS